MYSFHRKRISEDAHEIINELKTFKSGNGSEIDKDETLKKCKYLLKRLIDTNKGFTYKNYFKNVLREIENILNN